MATLRNYIEKFNEGEIDFVKIFGGWENFIKVVETKGLTDELVIIEDSAPAVENYLILYFLRNNKKKFQEEVVKLLSDVEVINGEYYLKTSESPGEVLSKLTCKNSREGLSPESVEEIIDGENDPFFFDNTTDDVYRDVVDDLNEKNLDVLANSIYENLKEVDIEVDEDLEKLTDQDTIRLTLEQIKNTVLKDDDTFNYVMKNYAIDLFDNLESIHRYAYEGAYSNEVHEDIWSEFSDIFEGKPVWSTEKHPYAQNKEIEIWRMKLPNFEYHINQYLDSSYPAATYDTLTYRGGYLEMLSGGLEECKNVYPPDYADWTKTKENINEMFLDWWEY
jgi:hypothetical protein